MLDFCSRGCCLATEMIDDTCIVVVNLEARANAYHVDGRFELYAIESFGEHIAFMVICFGLPEFDERVSRRLCVHLWIKHQNAIVDEIAVNLDDVVNEAERYPLGAR